MLVHSFITNIWNKERVLIVRTCFLHRYLFFRCDSISRPDLCEVLVSICLKLINFEDLLVFKVKDCNDLLVWQFNTDKIPITLTLSSTPSPQILRSVILLTLSQNHNTSKFEIYAEMLLDLIDEVWSLKVVIIDCHQELSLIIIDICKT